MKNDKKRDKYVLVDIPIDTDLEKKLKEKAAEMGMPYQTLIGTILHQYVTGKIKAEL